MTKSQYAGSFTTHCKGFGFISPLHGVTIRRWPLLRRPSPSASASQEGTSSSIQRRPLGQVHCMGGKHVYIDHEETEPPDKLCMLAIDCKIYTQGILHATPSCPQITMGPLTQSFLLITHLMILLKVLPSTLANQSPSPNVGPNYAHQLSDLDHDLPFSQPVTFAHLPWHRCLAPTSQTTNAIDIAASLILYYATVIQNTPNMPSVPTPSNSPL